MEFLDAKEGGMVPFILPQLLDTCIDGITLSDPDIEDNPHHLCQRSIRADYRR